ALEALDDLVVGYVYAAIRTSREVLGRDHAVDLAPLASPIVADRVTPSHVAALPPVGPLDVRRERRKDRIDLASVETLVKRLEQRLHRVIGRSHRRAPFLLTAWSAMSAECSAGGIQNRSWRTGLGHGPTLSSSRVRTLHAGLGTGLSPAWPAPS